jgi:hypothetical protein
MAVMNAEGGLSREIESFTIKLMSHIQAINQDEHHKTRQMVAEMLTAQPSSNGVADIIAEIEILDVDDDEEERFRRAVTDAILTQLGYAEMMSRYEAVVEAHPKTFEWIFSNTSDDQMPWTDFKKWLQEGVGLYWINGKAGSGKSTLMKHIYDDVRTTKYLEKWAEKSSTANSRVCLAFYFFWNSGTDMQKSHRGLLRSLLCQILSQYPDLIPLVLPKRWAKLYFGTQTLGRAVHDPWSDRHLMDAFEKLVQQKEFPWKLCISSTDWMSLKEKRTSSATSSKSLHA